MRMEGNMKNRVVVIGSGVAGLKAAFTLRGLGYSVTIVEKKPYTGGTTTLLDEQFPTDACGFCRMLPRFGLPECEEYCLKRGVGDIEVLRGYELEDVSGRAGDFNLTVIKKAPYVLHSLCIGCGRCEEVCGVRSALSEFAKAIHRATKISSLNEYAIDSNCTKCGECVKVCPTSAIFLEGERRETIGAGAIILALGFDEFVPYEYREYGYGRFANVLTSLELERTISLNEGKPIRRSDSALPGKVAFIQCVGSRDEKNPWCSSACCMYALKEIRKMKKNLPEVEIKMFYMDMRAFGKEYWKYYTETEGVEFVRCRVPRIEELENKNLLIRYEDESGAIFAEEFNLVVLSVGQAPSRGVKDLATKLGIQIDGPGYARTKSFDTFETTRDGIYAVGSFVSPKDISDAVSSGAACAIEIANKLGLSTRNRKNTEIPNGASGTILYLCTCNKELSRRIDFAKIKEKMRTYDDILSVEEFDRLCNPDGLEFLSKSLAGKKPSNIIIAACQGYYFSSLFRNTIEKSLGYIPGMRIVDIKTIRDNTDSALSRIVACRDIFRHKMQVPAVRYSPQNQKVLIVGGGVSGISSALALAKCSIPVVIAEKSDKLGGPLYEKNGLFNGIKIRPYLEEKIKELGRYNNVEVKLNAKIESLKGSVGNYDVKFADEQQSRNFAAVVIAVGAPEHIPKDKWKYNGENIILNTEYDKILRMEIIPKRIGFVQCVDSLTKERGYCSRACCRKSMELALALLKKDPTTKIYFFVKEVMSYGENELLYRELRSRGALFFRYNEDNPLRIVNVNENKFVHVNESLLVHVYDPILSRDLEFALDLLVLAPGVDAPSFDVIGVDRDSFGFFVGLDTKFSPQETERAGLFVVGSGRMPMSFGEAWVDGMACAAQIVSYIVNESVPVRRARAYVSERKCVKCLLCVSACPYGARLYDDESNIVRVNEITCQGCGACAVFCPSQATDMVEFSASGVMSAVMDLAIFG